MPLLGSLRPLGVLFAAAVGTSQVSPPATSSPPTPAPYRQGETAAEFRLPDLDGKPVKLSDFRGRHLLIAFVMKDCAECQIEAPLLEKQIWKALRDDGLSVLASTADPPEEAAEMVGAASLTFPVLLDRDRRLGEAFGVEGTPHLVLLDKEGKVRFSRSSAHVAEVLPEIRKALAEGAPRPLDGSPTSSRKSG